MPKIGRPRAEVVVTDAERAALVRLTKRARVNQAMERFAHGSCWCVWLPRTPSWRTVCGRRRRPSRSGAGSSSSVGSRGCTTSRASARLARSPTSRRSDPRQHAAIRPSRSAGAWSMTRLILEITVQGTSPPQPAKQRQSADPTRGRPAEAMADRAGHSSGAGTA
jgi:hypothetical protein